MKATTLLLSVLFLVFIFGADARVRRTNYSPNTGVTPPFAFNSGTTLCNRNFTNLATKDNLFTSTFNSDADCSGSLKTSVNRAFVSVSTNILPTFTLQAYKLISDAAPQFSASLVLVSLFEYTKNASSTVTGFDPNLDTILNIQPFYNATNLTQHYFTIPFMTSSVISGVTGKTVTTYNFNTAGGSNIQLMFIVDIVSTPTLLNSADQVNPGTLKITVDLESYSYQHPGKNLSIQAYLITSKPLGAVSTNSAGRVSVPIQTDANDKTGGSLGWDNQFFDSSTPSVTPNSLNMYSTPFSADPSPSIPSSLIPAGSTAQRVYYSLTGNTTPMTIVWDTSIDYLDVGAASGLQIGFAAIFVTITAIMTILF